MESSKWRRMSMLPSSEPPSITINSVCSSRSAMMLSSSEGSSCRAWKTTLMIETRGGVARAASRKRRPPSMRVAVGSVKLTLCTRDSIQNKVWLHCQPASRVSLRWLKSWAAWCSIIQAGGAVQGNLVEIVIFGAGGFGRRGGGVLAGKNGPPPTAGAAFAGGGEESVTEEIGTPRWQ